LFLKHQSPGRTGDIPMINSVNVREESNEHKEKNIIICMKNLCIILENLKKYIKVRAGGCFVQGLHEFFLIFFNVSTRESRV